MLLPELKVYVDSLLPAHGSNVGSNPSSSGGASTTTTCLARAGAAGSGSVEDDTESIWSCASGRKHVEDWMQAWEEADYDLRTFDKQQSKTMQVPQPAGVGQQSGPQQLRKGWKAFFVWLQCGIGIGAVVAALVQQGYIISTGAKEMSLLGSTIAVNTTHVTVVHMHMHSPSSPSPTFSSSPALLPPPFYQPPPDNPTSSSTSPSHTTTTTTNTNTMITVQSPDQDSPIPTDRTPAMLASYVSECLFMPQLAMTLYNLLGRTGSQAAGRDSFGPWKRLALNCQWLFGILSIIINNVAAAYGYQSLPTYGGAISCLKYAVTILTVLYNLTWTAYEEITFWQAAAGDASLG